MLYNTEDFKKLRFPLINMVMSKFKNPDPLLMKLTIVVNPSYVVINLSFVWSLPGRTEKKTAFQPFKLCLIWSRLSLSLNNPTLAGHGIYNS